MTKSKCATCHHDEETEKCSSCHTLQSSLYAGTVSVPNFIIEPDIMFEADVECFSCHNYSENESIIPKKENCMECHEEEDYLNKFDSWRMETNDAFAQIEKWLKINKKLKLSDEQKSRVESVKEILSVLKTDNSKGAHNYNFYDAVLKDCQAQLNQIQPLK